MFTETQVPKIVAEAREAAYQAAMKFFKEKLGGQDQFACGFAWVDIIGVRSNSKLGKAILAEKCFRKSYTRSLQMWNPSSMMVQNVDTLEAGAEAAAEVFRKYGFEAYAGSRLD